MYENLDHEASIAKILYAPFPAKDHEFHGFFKFCYLKEEAINTRLTKALGMTGWNKVVTGRQYIPQGEPVVEMSSGNRKDRILLSNYPGDWEAKSGKFYQIVDNVVVLEPASKGVPAKTEIQGKKQGPEISVIYDIPAVLVHGYMEIRIGDFVARRDSTGGDVLTDLGRETGSRIMNTYKSADTDLLKRLARQFGVGLYLTEIKTAGFKVENETDLAKWLEQTYHIFDNVIAAKTFLIEDMKGVMNAAQIGDKLKALNLTGDDVYKRYDDVIAALRAA